MPRWANRVPVPRLHKASGQARVKADGKEVWLGKFGSAEAKRRYAEFLKEYAERRDEAGRAMAAPPAVTISVAVHRFRLWAEGRYRHPDGTPTREAENLRHALRPLRQRFGALPVAEFGPGKLFELQAEMVESGIARRTVNARVGKVRRFFKWCVARELAPSALVAALAAVEPLRAGQGGRETPGRRPVAWATVQATLPHLPALLAALVRVLWWTGARCGEIAGLTTGEIDRSGAVWRATLAAHKCAWRGQERVILFGPEAGEAIRPWLRPDEATEAIFDPRRVDRARGKKGGKRAPGHRYARRSLPQALRRATTKAGVEPWTLGQLRHSRATLLRERFGLDVAAVVLGHARPTMTAHYSRTALAHALDAVGQAG
jgi:integrase